MDKEQLYDLYVTQKLPLEEIGQHFGISRCMVVYHVRKFDLPRRNQKPRQRTAGETVGEWTLLEKTKKNGRGHWQCRCSCGEVALVDVASINKGSSNCCWTCSMRNNRDNRPVPNRYWSHLTLLSKRRNIEISISHEYLEELWEKQSGFCALTGWPIKFAWGITEHIARKTTASLDRIKSDAGYIPGNVQWVHKDANNIKQNFSEEYLLTLCDAIVKHAATKDGCSEQAKEGRHAGSPEVPSIRKYVRRSDEGVCNSGDETPDSAVGNHELLPTGLA